MIDVNRYRKGRHITATELGEDTRIEDVTAVQENTKFGKLELVLESGDIFSLNTTNLEKMIKHYGIDERRWVGRKIELYVGEVPFNGKPVASVLLRPVSPDAPKAGASPGRPSPPKGRGDAVHRRPLEQDEIDEIPFNR